MAVAHDLAAAMEGDPRHDRAASAGIVTRAGQRRPELFGTWVAFERNAFDGRDRQFAGRAPLGDPRGAFAIWASRPKGRTELSAFADDPPGTAWQTQDYYTTPLETNRDHTVEPYLDTGTMMTSYTTPIRRPAARSAWPAWTSRCPRSTRRSKAIRVLDSGYAFVAAPSGLLVSFPAKKGWAGKRTVRSLGLPALHGPIEAVDPVTHRDVVIFTAPVPTGGWTFAAVAPKDEVLAPVHRCARR